MKISHVLSLAAVATTFAASPRLDLPVVRENRSIELTLRGDAGAEYSLEWSTNLTTWAQVGEGTALNGVLTFTHDASAFSTVFYRAKASGATDGLSIFPETLSLTVGSDGTLFTSIPNNTVEWSSSAPE